MVVALVSPDVLWKKQMKKYLVNVLTDAGFDMDEVDIVPILDEDFFTVDVPRLVRYSKEVVIPYLQKHKPTLIIPFGNNALCSVGCVKKPSGINSHRGRKCEAEELPDFTIIPTTDIGATFRSPQQLQALMTDLRFAYGVYTDNYIEEQPFNMIMMDDPDIIMDVLLPEVQLTGKSGYDYETSGLDAWACLPVTCTYATGKLVNGIDNVYAYAGYDDLVPRFNEIVSAKFVKRFTQFYMEAGKTFNLIGWNIGFDDWVAETHCGSIELPGSQFDAQIMKWCFDSTKPNNLKDATARYLGFPNYDAYIGEQFKKVKERRAKTMFLDTEDGIADWRCLEMFLTPEQLAQVVVEEKTRGIYKGKKTWKWPKDLLDSGTAGFAMIDLPTLLHYNCLDSLYTLKLHDYFHPRICNEGLIESCELRHDSNRVLWKTEQRGMLLDQDKNRAYSEELKDIIEVSLKKIEKLAYKIVPEIEEFNPNSDADVIKVLYGPVAPIPRIDRKRLYRDFEEASVDIICDKIEGKYYSNLEDVKVMLREDTFDVSAAMEAMQDDFYYETDDTRMIHFTDSPLGLGGLCYDPPAVTKKTGAPSCSKASLLTLQEKNPTDLVSLILMHRKAKKLKKTFIDNVYNSLRPGGVVSASYNTTGTETARISSSSRMPHNKFQWQNFPKYARGQFIARPGKIFITLDLSAAEVRCLAAFSMDENLIEALKAGDMHRAIASKVFKKPESEITDQERTRSKTATFLILYGGGADKLAAAFGITKSEAQEIIDMMFAAFPCMKEWMDTVVAKLAEGPHYIRTALGTRRWLLNILSEDMRERLKAERQAVNSVIQGSTGELTLYTILDVLATAEEEGFKEIHLAATVHDSETYEVPEEYAWNVPVLNEDGSPKLDKEGHPVVTPTGPMVDLIKRVFANGMPYHPLNMVEFPIDISVSKFWDGEPNLHAALDGKSKAEAFRYELLIDDSEEADPDDVLIDAIAKVI